MFMLAIVNAHNDINLMIHEHLLAQQYSTREVMLLMAFSRFDSHLQQHKLKLRRRKSGKWLQGQIRV